MIWIKKHSRALVVIGTTLFVLCAISVAAVSHYLNSAAFRRGVLERLNGAIAGRLTVGGHHISLFSGRVAFDDVALWADSSPLAVADRLLIEISWPALLRREVRITRLGLKLSELTLALDDQDRLALIRALAVSGNSSVKPSRSASWRVRVDDFLLEAGAVAFERPANQWSATADGIKISGRADPAQLSGHLEMALARLAWQGTGGGEQVVNDLTVVADHAPSRDQPLGLTIRLPGGVISVRGAFDWQSRAPRMDLAYDLDLDLASIQAFLPPRPALAGRAKAKGKVQGAWDDPKAILGLEIGNGRVEDYAFERLVLDASLDQRIVTLAAMQVRSDSGDIDLTGRIDLQSMFTQNFRKAAAGPESVVYDLKVDARDLQPEKWPALAFPLRQGKWQLLAHAKGAGIAGSGITGQADLTIESKGALLKSEAWAIDGQLSADVSWADQVVAIKNLSAAAGQNRLSATGRWDVASRQTDWQAQLDVHRMDALGALLDVALPDGRAALSLHGTGSLRAPHIRASLLAREVVWKEWTIGRVLAESQLSPDGILAFSRIVLENQGSYIEGQGSLALLDDDKRVARDPAVGLSLAFEALVPKDFHPSGPLDTSLTGRLRLGGTFRHLRADLDLDQSPLQWKEFACMAQGKALWEDGRLTISNLHLSKDASALDLEGHATWRDPATNGWTADPEVYARLRSQTLDLNFFDKSLSGALALRAEVDGTASNLQGSYRLQGGALDFGIQKLQSLASAGRLEGRRLTIDKMVAAVADGQDVDIRGWYDFDQRYALSLQGAGIELKHIDSLQRAYPITGRMNIQLEGGGSLSQPNMSGRLAVTAPRFKDQALDDFSAQLRIEKNRIDLQADLNFALKGSGRLDSGEFDLEAVFDRSDLSPYLAMGPGPGWSGHLTGLLQARGNWRSPLKIQLTTALSDLQIAFRDIPLLRTPRLELRIVDGIVDLPLTHVQVMDDGHLVVQATGAFQRALDIQADGRLPLAALAPFADWLTDAQGDVEIHAKSKALSAKTDWQADVHLKGIGMTLPGMSQEIRAVNGHITIDPQELVVDDLSGQLGDGRFSLDGQLGIEEMRPVRGSLKLVARNLPLQWPGNMDVVLHGDLDLVGKPRGGDLTGRVDLIEGTYYKDLRFNLLSAVTGAKRRRALPVEKEPPPWMDAIGLDVVVGYRNPLVVDNNLANLQVVPNFRVRGTLARPSLSGRAEVTSGEVIYRRKSFAVKRGVVDFINPYKIEPTLDIVSETQIRKWQVSLAVTGTPDQMQLKLSSNPPEADNDILSLILLGQTSTELRQGEGGESQTTTQMLASLIATAWGEDVRRTTGMDILELETGARDEEDSQDRAQVTVGKKLSRRLTLKYAVESNHGDMIQKAISEYRFLEHLLVSGFQDSRGDYGGELLFRIEFQ